MLDDLPKHLEKYNPSLTKLEEFFGEEFRTNCEDLNWLAGAVKMLREKLMLAEKVTPPWFNKKAKCKNCGDVWLESEGEFEGCPWCFIERKKSKPEMQGSKAKKLFWT